MLEERHDLQVLSRAGSSALKARYSGAVPIGDIQHAARGESTTIGRQRCLQGVSKVGCGAELPACD